MTDPAGVSAGPQTDRRTAAEKGWWKHRVVAGKLKRGRVDLTDDVHAVTDGPDLVRPTGGTHRAGHHVAVHHQGRCTASGDERARQDIAGGGRPRVFRTGRKPGVAKEIQQERRRATRAGLADAGARGFEAVEVDPHEALTQRPWRWNHGRGRCRRANLDEHAVALHGGTLRPEFGAAEQHEADEQEVTAWPPTDHKRDPLTSRSSRPLAVSGSRSQFRATLAGISV